MKSLWRERRMARDFNVSTSTSNIANPSNAMDGFHQSTLTVMVWIHPDSDGGNSQGRIYNTYDVGGASEGLFFNQSESGGTEDLKITIVNSGTNSVAETTANPVTLATWNNVGFTWAGVSTGAPTIFVDGADVTDSTTNGTGSIGDNDGVLYIGDRSTATRSFDGEMANFALWTVVLTANELLALSHGVNPFAIRNASCVLNLPFWGNQSPEPDYSGEGNTDAMTDTTKSFNPPVELLENYL